MSLAKQNRDTGGTKKKLYCPKHLYNVTHKTFNFPGVLATPVFQLLGEGPLGSILSIPTPQKEDFNCTIFSTLRQAYQNVTRLEPGSTCVIPLG